MNSGNTVTPVRRKRIGFICSLLFIIGVIIFVGGGMFALFFDFDYAWRWERIPQFFYYVVEQDVYVRNDGTVESITHNGQTVHITIKGSQSQQTYEVSFDTVSVSEGNAISVGERLGALNVWKIGVLTKGLLLTLCISGIAMFGALVIGGVGGMTLYAGIAPSRWIVRGLATFVHGVPLLWQILLWYFFVSQLFRASLEAVGMNAFSPSWFGVAALVFYAGIPLAEGIHHELLEMEKDRAGASGIAELFARGLPLLAEHWSIVLKASSLLSIVAVNELTKMARNAVAATLMPFEMILTAVLVYFIVVLLSSMTFKLMSTTFRRYAEARNAR